MTSGLVPQRCRGCGSLLDYEGYLAQRRHVVRHRFHCHTCGRVYGVLDTSEKRPLFAIRPRNEVQEFSPGLPLPPVWCSYWSWPGTP